MSTDHTFTGFQSPTSNTTYTPNQFFDVVIPHASRGVVRLVAYMIRKTLGWSDAQGNPQNSQLPVSYREIAEYAGIAQSKLRSALDEAIVSRFIQCISAGQPHSSGVTAQSGIYELLWDEQDLYTTNIETFRGFYAGNGNLTYIPNEFFDILIPNEPLAVIRVVGSIIRHTIGFQTRYGLRRQQIEMSFSELQRRTGIVSRRSLSDALKESLNKNYLQLVTQGYFDPQAGQNSKAATYGIRWQDRQGTEQTTDVSPPQIIVEPTTNANASKRIPEERLQKDTGGTPPKGYRERLQKDTGNASKRIPEERLQKDTGIKITDKNKILNKQQQQSAAAVGEISASLLHSLIYEDGFDEQAAHYLVASFPAEQIQRQRQWLSQRNIKRNKLGMLRRAIEQNWPQPEGIAQTESVAPLLTQADQFVRHFYAGLAGNNGTPVASPSENELRIADHFVKQLLKLWPDETQIASWGRAFGAFVQTSEQHNERKLRSFIVALRAYGDAYHVDFRKGRCQKIAQSNNATRHQHQSHFQEAYDKYLNESELHLRTKEPERYDQFLQEEQRLRQKQENDSLFKGKMLETMQRVFDSQEKHRERLCAFFRETHSKLVYEFWTWDACINPQRFESGAK